MSVRAATWLAWSLWVLSLVLFALIMLLLRANDSPQLPIQTFVLAEFLAFITVGALLSSRRPDNLIGWLFCMVAIANLLWAFAWQYAGYTRVTKPDRFRAACSWLGSAPDGSPTSAGASW